MGVERSINFSALGDLGSTATNSLIGVGIGAILIIAYGIYLGVTDKNVTIHSSIHDVIKNK